MYNVDSDCALVQYVLIFDKDIFRLKQLEIFLGLTKELSKKFLVLFSRDCPISLVCIIMCIECVELHQSHDSFMLCGILPFWIGYTHVTDGSSVLGWCDYV